MNTQRSLFACGLALGIGVGLLLSHFISRPMTSSSPTGTGQRLLSLSDPGTGLLNNDLLNNEMAAPLAARSPYFAVDDSSIETGLQEPNPLQNALAVETSLEPLQQTTNQLIPAPSASPGQEPGPLQIGDAAPLARNSAKDQQTIQGIIDIELSHLPQEKRQVWFDALKEVNKEDVAGILKMWKLLGGPIPDAPVGLAPAPTSASPTASPVFPLPALSPFDQPVLPPKTEPQDVEKQAGWIKLIAEAEQVLRRNQLMQQTPGYAPQIPYFMQLPMGEVSLTTREDFTAYRHLETGCPLDLAISGPGFFMLTDADGNKFLTRRGQFSLNAERQLVLEIGQRTLVLQPETVLPPSEPHTEMRIDMLGRILATVRQQQQTGVAEEDPRQTLGQIELVLPWQIRNLKPVGDGLYQLEEAHAQELNTVPLNHAETRLAPGHLEFPGMLDVSIEANLIKLKSSLSPSSMTASPQANERE